MQKMQLKSHNKNMIYQIYELLPTDIKKYIPERAMIYKKRDKSSNYPYSVTRIRAMRAKLIKKDEYNRFLNLSVDDIIRKIEELDYKKDIDELSRIYKGITLIEHGLNKNMADSFQKILKMTTGEPHDLISSYLKMYDIWNIKTILRGKVNNIQNDQILETIVSAGSLRYTFLSNLINSNLNDIFEWLKKTEYYKLFDSFNENNNMSLSKIENELDKYYYKSLFEDIGYPWTKDSKHFDDFIRREVDIKNIDTLIRMKKENINIENNTTVSIENENAYNMMIENGLKLNMEKLKLLSTLSYKDLLEELKKTTYWEQIQLSFESNNLDSDLSIRSLENHLLRYNLEKTTTHSRQSIISIIPILEYIIYKKNEVRNLRIILRGKSSGLEKDIIRKQLVVI